jgi:hypothetical protein
MNKETGGSAFPAEYFYDQETGYERMPAVGMTLRDYFAAKAMAAAMTNPHLNDKSSADIAMGSYRIADAMLEARNK